MGSFDIHQFIANLQASVGAQIYGDGTLKITDSDGYGTAYVVDVLCEGEIEGLVDGVNSIFLDEAALNLTDINAGKSRYGPFSEADQFRKGTATQSPLLKPLKIPSIPVFIGSSNKIPYESNYVLDFNNTTYPAAKYIIINLVYPNGLWYMGITDDGKAGKELQSKFTIELYRNKSATPCATYPQTLTRKYKNRFLAALYIDLETGMTDDEKLQEKISWTVKIRKTSSQGGGTDSGDMEGTKDSGRVYYSQLHIDSAFVVCNYSQNYPHTAICGHAFTSNNFSSIPQRNYHVKMRKIRIPTNYNPARLTYTGNWNGTFTTTEYYTTNPAWILYDILTNERYGIGNYVNATRIDKWTLYAIAKDCDEIVETDLPSETLYFSTPTSPMIAGTEYTITFKDAAGADKKLDTQLTKLYAGQKLTLWENSTTPKAAQVMETVDNDATAIIIKPDVNISIAGTQKLTFIPSEPKFSCNCLIKNDESALEVINNFSSIFAGILYLIGDRIYLAQDKYVTAAEHTQQFSNANVIDGVFQYSSAERDKIRSSAVVKWNDPHDYYRPKLEYIEDEKSVIEFGRKTMELTAFGCTSQGQARRVAKRALMAERLQREFISFEAGLEGVYCRPGDIVEIYDDFRHRQKFGGRIDTMTDKSHLLLDRYVNFDTSYNYNCTITTPTGNRDPLYTGVNSGIYGVTDSSQISGIRQSMVETRVISAYTYVDNKTYITVASPYSAISDDNLWTIQASGTVDHVEYRNKPYRILNLEETENQTIKVTAVEYNSEKFGMMEPPMQTGSITAASSLDIYIAPPTNFTSSISGAPDYVMFMNWTQSTGNAVEKYACTGKNLTYSVDVDQETISITSQTGAMCIFSQTGLYEFYVRAVQMGGKLSDALTGQITVDSSYLYSPPALDDIYIVNSHDGNRYTYAAELPYTWPRITFTAANERAVSGEFRFKYNGAYVSSAWRTGVNYLTDGSMNAFNDAIMENFFAHGSYDAMYLDYANLIAGWPIRDLVIEGKGIDIFGSVSTPIEKNITRIQPPSGNITFSNITPNEFDFDLDHEYIHAGSGKYLYVRSSSSPTPSETDYDFVYNSDVGHCQHNLNQDLVYCWFAFVDYFSDRELRMCGPYPVTLAATEPVGWNWLISNTMLRDSGNNDIPYLVAQWDRNSDVNARGYEIEIFSTHSGTPHVFTNPTLCDTNSGHLDKHFYFVPQSPSGTSMQFVIPYPQPNINYSGRIRGIDMFDRRTAWTSYYGVYSQQPTTRFLKVDGKSEFRDVTYVIVDSGNMSTNSTINFKDTNIFDIYLYNSADITLTPVTDSIQLGATYMIRFTRKTGAGNINFSSAFRFPMGEAPQLTTEAEAVDVMAICAFSPTGLECSINYDFQSSV